MKTGLILEGGAVRGIFTAGVLDRLMESGVYFPYVVGVSAGGGNAMSYVSGQKGRTARMINVPSSDSYFGFRQFLESKRVINLDKMVYEYPYKQFPFDFDTYFASSIETEYVCTCCETGEAEYFGDISDEQRLLNVVKATCSVPMLCEPVEIDGMHYLDGSIADSIPIEHSLEQGCDKLVIILTKPDTNTQPTDYRKFKTVINSMYRQYPAFVEACMSRVERYERTVELMEELREDGRAFIFRPTLPAISKFEHDSDKIMDFYRDGYMQADKRIADLMNWTKSGVGVR
jgi:predicted patatin/cPLA2 family phospholipase